MANHRKKAENTFGEVQCSHEYASNDIADVVSFNHPAVRFSYSFHVWYGCSWLTCKSCVYFRLVCVLGIQNYGIKVCAMVRDDIVELSKVVKELLVILLVSTSIVFAVYLLSIFLIPTSLNSGHCS